LENVEAFSRELMKKGGDCEKTIQVACDMSGAYRSGVNPCFPKAIITIDKFHVKQLMQKALDQVRREKQGKKHSRRRDAGKKILIIIQSAKRRARGFRTIEGYTAAIFLAVDNIFYMSYNTIVTASLNLP